MKSEDLQSKISFTINATSAMSRVEIYVPREVADALRSKLDVAECVAELNAAVNALENGNGIGATDAAINAVARLLWFHR